MMDYWDMKADLLYCLPFQTNKSKELSERDWYKGVGDGLRGFSSSGVGSEDLLY